MVLDVVTITLGLGAGSVGELSVNDEGILKFAGDHGEVGLRTFDDDGLAGDQQNGCQGKNR